jgi:hypothetical protein
LVRPETMRASTSVCEAESLGSPHDLLKIAR